MSKDNTLDSAIQDYLDNGGEITRIRYADKKLLDTSSRKSYHLSKAHDNETSKSYLEREEKKESQLIFTKDERMKE